MVVAVVSWPAKMRSSTRLMGYLWKTVSTILATSVIHYMSCAKVRTQGSPLHLPLLIIHRNQIMTACHEARRLRVPGRFESKLSSTKTESLFSGFLQSRLAFSVKHGPCKAIVQVAAIMKLIWSQVASLLSVISPWSKSTRVGLIYCRHGHR